MKPVRRRIRRHFGLTAKQMAVRSQRPWYFQWGVALLLVVVGYTVAYKQFSGGGENLSQQLGLVTLQNQSLQTKLIQVERQLQIEQVAQANLEKNLNLVQDENIHFKEDLLYKNMVRNRKPPSR